MNNQRLHASAEALNRTLRRSSETEASFTLGPDGDAIEQAPFGAWWTFVQILSRVLDHFEFPPEVRDHLANLFDTSAPSSPDEHPTAGVRACAPDPAALEAVWLPSVHDGQPAPGLRFGDRPGALECQSLHGLS